MHRVALFADVIMCFGLILIMGGEGIIYSDSDRDAKEKNDRGLNKTGINGLHIGGFVFVSISLVIWIGRDLAWEDAHICRSLWWHVPCGRAV